MKKTVVSMMIGAVLAPVAVLAQADQTGNGSQPGSHYTLNILGKTDCTPADTNPNQGHTIQVLLVGGQKASDINGTTNNLLTIDRRNKIFLQPGDDFQVLDGNGCDGALFMLPTNICYKVYARGLGKPGGYADITTCAIDSNGTTNITDDVVVCSTSANTIRLDRTKKKFIDVTDELTTITIGTTTVPIFDSSLYGYFWNYDNHGLRLAQIRFYPVDCPE